MASSTQAPNTVPQNLRVIATNEKVTGPAGLEMLKSSGIATSISNDLNVLDNCCGGGVLTAELLSLLESQESSNPGQEPLLQITAADLEDRMVAYTTSRRQSSNNINWKNVTVTKQDQQKTSFPSGTFTHVFNNFGIFFASDPDAALAESLRLLRPNVGVAGFTTWKAISWWDSLALPALAEFVAEAPKLPHPSGLFANSGWNDPESIRARLEKVGFVDVRVEEFGFTPLVEAEEFAEACAVLANVAARRVWSGEEFEQFGGRIEPAFLRYLRENFEGGRWNGKMTSIIALARRP